MPPSHLRRLVVLLVAGLGLAPAITAAALLRFDIPAQSAADALLAFAKQSGVDVLFSAADLKKVRANEVKGEFEPDAALARLLAGTGFAGQRDAAGKFVIAAAAPDPAVETRPAFPRSGFSRAPQMRSKTGEHSPVGRRIRSTP
jgi:iron complex outermembrane recepter protein